MSATKGLLASNSIATGINAGLSLFNTWSQARQNKKDRKFQEHMYDKQRVDALQDRDYANAYNHPGAEMKRLHDAGLNANLAYGNIGQSAAAEVRSSQSQGGNQPAPQIPEEMLMKMLSTFAQITSQQQQNENLKAQAELLKVQKERTEFDLSAAKSMLPFQLTAAELANRQTQANTQFTINSDQRAAIAQGADLKKITEEILRSQVERMEAMQRIAKSKAEIEEIEKRIENLKAATSGHLLDNQLKAFKVDMANDGINPDDPSYIRNLMRLLSLLFED